MSLISGSKIVKAINEVVHKLTKLIHLYSVKCLNVLGNLYGKQHIWRATSVSTEFQLAN